MPKLPSYAELEALFAIMEGRKVDAGRIVSRMNHSERTILETQLTELMWLLEECAYVSS